ncbi:MAG: GMC family oxidoreductase [Burkholderiales bacterium]
MAAQDIWDFVVVGAGAAGCVLANRLSASGEFRVLVLEAGGPDNKVWIKVPAGFTRTLFDPAIGWGYANAPSPGTANRTIPCPRGRVLGGSSSINGHLFVRGQAADYEDWVALGASGWGWEDVLPYFKRAEHRAGGDEAVRGREGPLEVTDPRLQHPLCKVFFRAMQEAGHGPNPDYNAGRQEGYGFYQYLTKNGRRWSAADAYLRPAMRRSNNLEVRTHAQVARVLFEGKVASGVEYRQGGSLHRVNARREVILAGGAINSPQLLQLSGVGDPELLRKHAIPLVHAAPGVGENLSDHYAVRIASRVRGMQSLNELTRGPRLALEVLKYLLARKGVLTSAVAHAFGFIRSNDSLTRPDVQLLVAPASYEQGKVGQGVMERLPGISIGVTQLRPYSRGHVRVVYSDPFAPPEIQPNYLADARDMESVLGGIRFVRKLLATHAFEAVVESETWPGAKAASDEQLAEFVRTTGSTIYHPVGSCRMGGPDAGAPLDPQLRVRGLRGLRVIDASAMPSMVSGNTYAATIMLAEKGADCVLQDARV